MKYVIIADIHIQFAGYNLLIDGIPERIYFPVQNLKNAADYAKENNAELIIAGDIIEESAKVPQIVLDYVFDILDYCASQVQTYIVIGNHDYVEYKGKLYTYLKHVNPEIQVAYPGSPIVIGDTVLIGHSYSPEIIREDFQVVDENTKLVVSHFGIQEAIVGESTTYKGGEFSIKDFKYFTDKLLVLGHYHKPQQVSDNILYVGSPTPVKIDERDDQKRFIMVDTEDLKIIDIPTTYPRHITIELTYDKTFDPEEIKNDVLENYSKYIFILPHDHPQRQDIIKLENNLKGYIYKYIEETKEEQEEVQFEDISKISLQDIADEFLEKSSVPKDLHNQYKRVVEPLLKVS